MSIRRPVRAGRAFLLAAVLIVGATACHHQAPQNTPTPLLPPTVTGGGAPVVAPVLPLTAASKDLGVALPKGYAGFARFTQETGTVPKLNELFLDWNGQYPAAQVQAAWDGGAMTLVSWQPDALTLEEIADGAGDAVVRRLAAQSKAAKLPVLMDFAHEFNGNWYPWGTQANTPAQFVAAWRHVHDLFVEAGATSVSWVWSPNVVNPVPEVDLAAYWPGAQYVDFAGLVGYWTGSLGEDSWTTLVAPTERKIRILTGDPIIITETGVQQGAKKAPWVTAMLKGFRADKDVVAMVYFDYGFAQGKRADWTLEDDPAALVAWRSAVASWSNVA